MRDCVGLPEALPLSDERGEEQGEGVVDWQCLGEAVPNAEDVAIAEPVWLCVGLPLTEALVLALGQALREPLRVGVAQLEGEAVLEGVREEGLEADAQWLELPHLVPDTLAVALREPRALSQAEGVGVGVPVLHLLPLPLALAHEQRVAPGVSEGLSVPLADSLPLRVPPPLPLDAAEAQLLTLPEPEELAKAEPVRETDAEGQGLGERLCEPLAVPLPLALMAGDGEADTEGHAVLVLQAVAQALCVLAAVGEPLPVLQLHAVPEGLGEAEADMHWVALRVARELAQREVEGVGLREAELQALRLPDTLTLALLEPAGVALEHALPKAEGLELVLPELHEDALTNPLAVGVRAALGLAQGETEGHEEGDCEWEAQLEAEGLELNSREAVAFDVALGIRDSVARPLPVALGVVQGLEEGVRDAAPLALGDRVLLRDVHALPLLLPLEEEVGVREGEGDCEKERVGEGEREAEREADTLELGLPTCVPLLLGVLVGEGDTVPEGEAVGRGERKGEREALEVRELRGVVVGRRETVPRTLALALALGQVEGEPLCEGDTLTESEGVAWEDVVADAQGVAMRVAEALALGHLLAVPLAETVPEPEGGAEPDAHCVPVAQEEAVGEGMALLHAERLGVSDEVELLLPLPLALLLEQRDAALLGEALPEAHWLDEGEAVARPLALEVLQREAGALLLPVAEAQALPLPDTLPQPVLLKAGLALLHRVEEGQGVGEVVLLAEPLPTALKQALGVPVPE